MGLPIAVGGRALSSRPIPVATPLPEDADDGTALEPVVLDCAPRVVTAVSEDSQLAATCCISYYDMIRRDNGQCNSTIAEICIQISPLAQAYSGTYRDALYRIPLPECSTQQHDFIPIQPSAVFASDGRHLACLVPHPRARRSILVMFQLRKPRSPPPAPPPRPSYLGPAPDTPMIPVATNPRVVKLPNNMPLVKASAICNAFSEKSGGCVLLAGCVDGSIVVIAYRLVHVAGILHNSQENDAIVFMSHRTDSHNEEGSFGKLVAIEQRSGAAVIFTSHLVVSNTTNLHLMHLQRRYELQGPFAPSAVWMESCFLALIVKPGQSAAAQVWAIAHDEEAVEPISTLLMTSERLDEYAHGSFALQDNNATQEDDQEFLCVNSMATALHFDESSGCLAVSSFVLSSSGDAIASDSRYVLCPLTRVLQSSLMSHAFASYLCV